MIKWKTIQNKKYDFIFINFYEIIFLKFKKKNYENNEIKIIIIKFYKL